MTSLSRLPDDLRYATRALAARPLTLLVAVASIAIGAALNLGVYSVVRPVLFDSQISAPASDRLVLIEPGISLPNYRDLRLVDLPIDLAAMKMQSVTWRTPDRARTLNAHVVSDNFFDVIGVRALAGRTFGAADRDRTDLAVLSYGFWCA